MTSLSEPVWSLNPRRFLENRAPAVSREELLPSVILACISALLLNCLGLLWFVANVELRPATFTLIGVIVLAAATLRYSTTRFSPTIATVLGFSLAVQIGCIFGAANGYLVYSSGAAFPLIDARLYAADQWLGFNWLAMLQWFGGYPALVEWTRIAYDQAPNQVALALPILILMRQNDRLMKLLTATFLSLVVVHILAIFFPAVGVYGYLGLSANDHPGMILSSEGRTVAHVMQLRTGALFDLNQGPVMGLITFPSFHTIIAIQAAWAFWRVPGFRWLVLAFNVLVWVGTLFHGSHHLTDTLAGAIVAAASIYATYPLTDLIRAKLYPRFNAPLALAGSR